jgi:glycosyltransferase involved in cell wall biosynthesis
MTQRKGLADVFAAMKLLKFKDIELVVMGSLQADLGFYRAEYADFLYEPPRPHAEVLALMRSCDVLVLPSIVEGRALVQQEALSCGLPIVVTANAGGEDLIEEGKTGFLVPIRRPEAIAEKLAWFAEHRAEIPSMADEARKMAGATNWRAYENKVITGIQRLIVNS